MDECEGSMAAGQEGQGNTLECGWVALVLAAVAGGVDAIGYLTLNGLFTAHMSGNSVTLGVHLGQGAWDAALHRGVPIALFLVGMVFGALLLETGDKLHMRSRIANMLGLESLLLVAYMVVAGQSLRNGVVHAGSPAALYGLVALLTVAMGLQTSALRRVGTQSVRTTFITGTLNNLVEEGLGLFLQQRRAEDGQPGLDDGPRHNGGQVLLLAGVWSSYLAGAIVGSVTDGAWATTSLLIPVGLLVPVIAWHRWGTGG
jgi:uncharacterized membrane protein YoaK (UPF0700 family)